jgi:GntR family transcriptional regulator
VRAGAAVAGVLRVDRSEPLLRIERTAYTFNDLPVELRTTWVHTRHYHYLMIQGEPP